MVAADTLARPAIRAPRRTGSVQWADFGWHRLSRACVVLQLLLVAASVPLYRAVGLDVQWSTDRAFLTFIGLLAALWAALQLVPGDSRARRRLADATAAAILFLTLIQITAPMQYGALALGRPFIDPWLDHADRAMGIDVVRLTAWTSQYPRLVSGLNAAYNTLAPQLLVPLVLLPIVGDREALWEYLWHLHIALAGALLCLALWPAICPFTYRHYEPLVAPALVAHLTTQIRELHAGRFHVLGLQDMQGLISFPSFHAAAAFAVTWSLRRRRLWVWLPVALVNAALVSATVLLGIHYAIDLVGTAILLAVSLVLYRLVD
jgi:membrane-associated phospholipid phosphatase